MKFSATSSTLYQHLQTVAKVINPKSTNLVPVLSNILFELRGNMLTLTAADMTTRLTTTLEVNNEGGDGSFMASDRIVIDSLKDLPDQPISIEINTDSYQSRLSYANGHYDFIAAVADSYPASIQIKEEQRSIELPALSLLEGINSAKVAVATEELRPIMTGVLVDFTGTNIVYVASDGRVLVRYTDTRDGKGVEPAQLCLPPAVCKVLTSSLLPKESGKVRLSFDGVHVQIELSNFTLTARLLDGKYPPYNSVVPPSSPHNIIVRRDTLLYAAKRISLFANSASRLLLLDIFADKMVLKANDLDFSTSAEETIPCQASTVENIRIGFDYALLRSLLEAIDSEEITLGLSDQTRAGVITPVTTKEGIEMLSLIIPMKLIGHS